MTKRASSNPSSPHPSRRDFLVRSAAAAGALAVGTAAQQGANGGQPVPSTGDKTPLGDDEPIRMAIIGTGGMGGGHLNAIIGLANPKAGEQPKENVQIVALSDVCKPRLDGALAKARSRQQGVQVDGYRNYKDLLARDDVHCVLIASPEHWHARMAVDAIAAGKDVYLEKPMTLRLDEALWLNRVMEKNPHMRFQVGTQYMMRKKYGVAKKLIRDGVIGHPTFSQTSYCRNSREGEWLYKIDPQVKPGEMLDWDAWCGHLGPRRFDTEIYHRWRRYKDFSTGIVGDLLVHMMTPLLYALDVGWPVRVTASGGHYQDKAMENHDQVNLTIEFEREHTMIVAGSTCNEQGLETMIRGHEANIYLGSNNCDLRPERIFADDIDPKTYECEQVHEHNAIRLDWLRSVRTREQNASQVDLAVKIIVVVDLATRSMWDGPAFCFDPKTLTASPA